LRRGDYTVGLPHNHVSWFEGDAAERAATLMWVPREIGQIGCCLDQRT
jgi:hypothetical protein